MEERASELDRKRSENISVMAQINRRNRESTQKNIEMALAREAQEHRNTAADPFTRRRCAPTLVTKAPQLNTEDLKRELHERRAADTAAAAAATAAAAKKKADEQRLLTEKNKAFTTTTEIKTEKSTSEKSFSTMTTIERGSFTSFSEHNDEMFTSHDFELDLNIKLFPD